MSPWRLDVVDLPDDPPERPSRLALLRAAHDLTDGQPLAWADEVAAMKRAGRVYGARPNWRTAEAMARNGLIERARVGVWRSRALLRLTHEGHVTHFAQFPEARS